MAIKKIDQTNVENKQRMLPENPKWSKNYWRHSLRYEDESQNTDEYQSEDGSTKCERVSLMQDLQKETVPETYSGQ